MDKTGTGYIVFKESITGIKNNQYLLCSINMLYKLQIFLSIFTKVQNIIIYIIQIYQKVAVFYILID